MAIPKEVCTLFDISLVCSLRASVYVDFNLVNSLHSKTNLAISYPLNDKSFKVDELVENMPDLVFFPPGIFKFINRISPNCFGDAILNSFF